MSHSLISNETRLISNLEIRGLQSPGEYYRRGHTVRVQHVRVHKYLKKNGGLVDGRGSARWPIFIAGHGG